jgi:hypothetical protein
VAIGATIAKGEGATMIAVGRNTMTKAVVDADIHFRANQPDEFSWVPGSHPLLANKVVPPPAILLMHEFGHGLQYLADKGGYEALRTASYQQPDGKDIDLRIENDNIRKREAPVCLDLGQQVRWQYWDNTRPKGPPQYTPGVGHRVPQPYSGLGVGRKESIR